MNVRVIEDFGPVVPLGDVMTGFLYRYSFRPPGKHREAVIYLLATELEGKRAFVDLETGGFYNGDRGELRLLEFAQLTIGRS